MIVVSNCQECPFANDGGEYGFDDCNLSMVLGNSIKLDAWEQLPSDKRHEQCPINDSITITVK